MEIIIGRDPNTNHLAFLVDGKRGVDSSVTFPQSISRLRPNENMGHCRILIKNDDIRIINLNSENVTYVDGEEIKHSVKIDLHSIIELGMDQYIKGYRVCSSYFNKTSKESMGKIRQRSS